MSYDRKLDQICPHFVAEEPLFVSADRQTIRPIRPIASGRSVKVRLNGELDIPFDGCSVPANAVSLKAGPYNVITGVNDRLIVQIGNGTPQTLTVRSGKRVTAQDLARDLNATVKGCQFSNTSHRRLQLITSQKGLGATLKILTGSTLAPILGFDVNRIWRGRQTAPGWSLVNDPSTLLDVPTRLIVFDEPLKGSQDFVEISYTTVRQECRRCGGLGIENDWIYTRTGNTIEVRDAALLIQETLKVVYTIRGSNTFNLWYGTQITDAIGKKLTTNGLVQNFIVSDIYEAFRRWQQIKKAQEETVGQFVSDAEYPFRLVGVNLEQSEEDPTVVFVTVTVQNRSDQPIQIERGIRIPEPTDLLGSTAQQGVLRQSLSNFVKIG